MHREPPLYFDYASTTPVLPEAQEALFSCVKNNFGNAGSLHSFGQEAVRILDQSRETIAGLLNADFRQIIFTSSATEANNLALRGVFKKGGKNRKKIIISKAEHESILETAQDLASEGAEIVYLPVDIDGIPKIEELKKALEEEKILMVSLMFANNETGALSPIKEFCKIVKEVDPEIIFHTDASQAFQFVDCDVKALGVDMLTISSHKIYGPKGVATLYVKDLNTIDCINTGGGQEFGFRSGTENIPAISGFAVAVKEVSIKRDENRKRIEVLSQMLWDGIKGILEADINGPALGESRRTPNILNVSFKNRESEDMLVRLDMAGVAVSAGSACRSRSPRPSHVLSAMGLNEERMASSIRFSLGAPTTEEEIQKLIRILRNI